MDYCLLNNACFDYLHQIYGGVDIRRLSIEVPNVDDQPDANQREESGANDIQEETRAPREHIVEIQLRRLQIHIVPAMSFYPSLETMPFTIYTSRTATVGEVHLKIALGLLAGSNKRLS